MTKTSRVSLPNPPFSISKQNLIGSIRIYCHFYPFGTTKILTFPLLNFDEISKT